MSTPKSPLVDEVLRHASHLLAELTTGRAIWDNFRHEVTLAISQGLNPALERISDSIESLARAVDRHAAAHERMASALEGDGENDSTPNGAPNGN